MRNNVQQNVCARQEARRSPAVVMVAARHTSIPRILGAWIDEQKAARAAVRMTDNLTTSRWGYPPDAAWTARVWRFDSGTHEPQGNNRESSSSGVSRYLDGGLFDGARGVRGGVLSIAHLEVMSRIQGRAAAGVSVCGCPPTTDLSASDHIRVKRGPRPCCRPTARVLRATTLSSRLR